MSSMDANDVLRNGMKTLRCTFLNYFGKCKNVSMIPSFYQSVYETEPILKVSVIKVNRHEEIHLHLIWILTGFLSFIPEVNAVDVT